MSVAVGSDLQLRRRTLGFLASGARCQAPELQPAVHSALDALRGNNLTGALRVIDRCWRTLPDLASDLAPAFGWLLVLEGRDFQAALTLLRCVSEADPDIAALTVLTLLRQEHWEVARDELERSFSRFCVSAGSLLAAVARRVIEHPASTAPGWLGRGFNLDVLGEVSTRRSIATLEVQLGAGPAFTQLLRPSQGGTLRRFEFRAPGAATQALHVTLEGARLLGGGGIHDFALRGRLALSRGRLSGWARLGWSPERALRISAADELGSRVTLSTRSASGSFELSLRSAGLKGRRIGVEARMPDGHWQALPDSPLLLEAAVRLRETRPLKPWRAVPLPPGPTFAERAPVDVIVPVYGDAAAALRCVDAVLATLPSWAHLVVVDDASSDQNLMQELHGRARSGRMTLLRNDVNRGFAAAANRGLTVHSTHDAVLLNSDTCVYGDWLQRLREAAYGTARVGTVTPISNNGSIVSYPHPEGCDLDSIEAEQLDRLVAGAMPGRKMGLPVGVGFCLYLRRGCLNDIGTLDEAIFGAGYGEETDLCLRARQRGWLNLLAADVFVYHAGGASFGARRQALLARSARLINLRHPGYDAFVDSFTKADPLRPLRRRLDERRLRELTGRCVLMVTLSLPGGVDHYIARRTAQLRAEGLEVLLLRPADVVADPGRCELWTEALAAPNLRYDIPRELPGLLAMLQDLAPVAVELQHFLGLDPRLVEAVRTLPSGYDVVVHDSVWICPRVTLIDGSGRYCGEPAPKVCATCIRRNGSEIEGLSVPALRRRSAKWLGGAQRIFAPSQDTAQRIQRYFGLAVEVRPHSHVVPATHPAWSAAAGPTVRVALLGAIGTHKGYDLLLACAHDARRRRLPLEFLVIGYTSEDDPLLATGRVFITGPYKDPELPHLLKRERPDLIWLPSVAPETWSYTLDHALRAGLPIVSFDIGAIAERLRAVQLGTLLPLDLSPKAINNHLLELARNKESTTTPLFESLAALPAADNVDKMALTTRGDLPMKKNAENAAPATTQEEGIGASVQVLPLPPGMYLFAVTAAAANPGSTAGVNLPAVHVTPGPGVDPAQVEFINGRGGNSAWLFAQGDMLVARVSGVQTTLILTSVRAPGGDVLSIKIERLDGKTSESTASASVAPLMVPTVAPVTLLPDGSVPMQISAHIRSRGDLTFTDVAWAGRIARGLWIESFALLPRAQFGADDIEYKGLTASGFETPWIGDQKMCGTRGMAVPLVGFAVRLKPSPETAGFDCEYSGYFQSGVTVGPLRNGAPCRSTVANDPLEGLQVKLTPRVAADASAAKPAARATRPARRS